MVRNFRSTLNSDKIDCNGITASMGSLRAAQAYRNGSLIALLSPEVPACTFAQSTSLMSL